MERVVTITTKKSSADQRGYWLTRPVVERLEGLEKLRETHIQTLPDAEQGFQRGCTMVKTPTALGVFGSLI